MFDVSFQFQSGKVMQYWDQLLTNFGVPAENVWVRNLPAGSDNIYTGVYDQPYDISQLQDKNTIVLAPPNGLYIQGTESLVDFTHPDNALYFFGFDHSFLEQEELDGLNVTNYVYIPQHDKHDMYSFCSATCVLYDRLVKNG